MGKASIALISKEVYPSQTEILS